MSDGVSYHGSGAGPATSPQRREAAIDAKAIAIELAHVLAENRCTDVVLLDVRGSTDVCDYLLIASGSNRPLMKAALGHVEERARELGEHMLPAPDNNTEKWMVADFVDVTVHLFNREWRQYYDLEMLWGDCPKVELNLPELAGISSYARQASQRDAVTV